MEVMKRIWVNWKLSIRITWPYLWIKAIIVLPIQFEHRALPTQKNNGASLSGDRQKHDRISQDQVQVENYFGRETKLWSILNERYTISERSYYKMVDVCRFLTNFSCDSACTRTNDNEAYQERRRLFFATGHKQSLKNIRSKTYKKRRQQCLEAVEQDTKLSSIYPDEVF